MTAPDLQAIDQLATKLWGEPNRKLSKGDDLRFGSQGSKSVDVKNAAWYDHEACKGGGYASLYKMVYGDRPPDQSFAAIYDYHDASGRLVFQVLRKHPKQFVQRRPDGNGGWVWSTKYITRVPYRLPEILSAPKDATIFIVEGEKDADNLRANGLVATCNAGGAGKWSKGFSAFFKGLNVKVLPDNDPAGEEHAKDVARKLKGTAASVRILRIPGLPPKGDVSDWLAAGGTIEELERLASAPFSDRLEITIEPQLPTETKGYQHAWDKLDDTSTSPTIHVSAGKRHESANAGLAALDHANIPFYQRDKGLVRVSRIKAKASDGSIVIVPSVTAVNNTMLGRVLGQVARWQKIKTTGEIIPIDPPNEVVEQIAVMTDEWPFPPLRGVIDTPTLRPDGSLLQSPGYDAATGYVLFNPPPMPAIPKRPSKADALEALALLNNDLLAEFPFTNNASRSVAMSMLLTPVLRAAMAVAPAHVATAPEAGTGKSYLQDIASTIATGDRCAVMAMAEKPEETEKRLIGAALAQFPIIAMDNVNGLLMGDFLCQVTERPVLQIRPLGTSALLRIANTFTVFINGNNLVIGADGVRRCIQCALDANMESPEERTFRTNPVTLVLADRGKYIAACLTIARAYITAGRPGRLPPRASYEGWSDTVRSPLVWLGRPDPVETVASIRTDDPVRQQRAAVFAAWAAELTMEIGYQTAELIAKSEAWGQGERACPELFAALFAVAAARVGGQQIDSRRLAHWLRRNLDTVAMGRKLTVDRSDQQRPYWKLIAVERSDENEG